MKNCEPGDTIECQQRGRVADRMITGYRSGLNAEIVVNRSERHEHL